MLDENRDYYALNKTEDYCKCKQSASITSVTGEWGYWDVCCDCDKPLEDGFHYYNHYDGEDHDDSDLC